VRAQRGERPTGGGLWGAIAAHSHRRALLRQSLRRELLPLSCFLEAAAAPHGPTKAPGRRNAGRLLPRLDRHPAETGRGARRSLGGVVGVFSRGASRRVFPAGARGGRAPRRRSGIACAFGRVVAAYEPGQSPARAARLGRDRSAGELNRNRGPSCEDADEGEDGDGEAEEMAGCSASQGFAMAGSASDGGHKRESENFHRRLARARDAPRWRRATRGSPRPMRRARKRGCCSSADGMGVSTVQPRRRILFFFFFFEGQAWRGETGRGGTSLRSDGGLPHVVTDQWRPYEDESAGSRTRRATADRIAQPA